MDLLIRLKRMKIMKIVKILLEKISHVRFKYTDTDELDKTEGEIVWESFLERMELEGLRIKS